MNYGHSSLGRRHCLGSAPASASPVLPRGFQPWEPAAPPAATTAPKSTPCGILRRNIRLYFAESLLCIPVRALSLHRPTLRVPSAPPRQPPRLPAGSIPAGSIPAGSIPSGPRERSRALLEPAGDNLGARKKDVWGQENTRQGNATAVGKVCSVFFCCC